MNTEESPSRSKADQQALLDIWHRQRRWSEAANQLRTALDSTRQVVLLLTIATATLAVASEQLNNPPNVQRLLQCGAAITAALGSWLGRRNPSNAIRTWTAARTVAEGLKSEVYMCLAGGKAYQQPEPGQALRERASRILEEATDSAPALERVILNVDADAKPLPAVFDLASYLKLRVEEQIQGYFEKRARTYEQRQKRLHRMADGLGILAIIMTTAASVLNWKGLAVWVPAITTISAALAAHRTACRYEEQVIDYLRTARRLQALLNHHQDSGLSAAEMIEACETELAAANRSWRLGWNAIPSVAATATDSEASPRAAGD